MKRLALGAALTCTLIACAHRAEPRPGPRVLWDLPRVGYAEMAGRFRMDRAKCLLEAEKTVPRPTMEAPPQPIFTCPGGMTRSECSAAQGRYPVEVGAVNARNQARRARYIAEGRRIFDLCMVSIGWQGEPGPGDYESALIPKRERDARAGR